MSQVLIILGSESDFKSLKESKPGQPSTLDKALEVLNRVGVKWEVSIASAHRNPEKLREYVITKAKEVRDFSAVFMTDAGMSAQLTGAVASHVPWCPVIGVAMPSAEFPDATDAALSIERMPSGVPAGFLGRSKAGFVNAAIYACQILATGDADKCSRLRSYMEEQKDKKPAQFGIMKSTDFTDEASR